MVPETVADGVAFWREFTRLARRRLRSKEDYQRFQNYQAARVLRDIDAAFKCYPVARVIDYGCGFGGYSEVLAAHFPQVLGVDYFVDPAHPARPNLEYVRADLLRFRTEMPADLIFCSSVIEHIGDQRAFIENLRENLRPGGLLYLSFPPFYSPGGGHALKGLHYLPESVAIGIGRQLGLVDPRVTGYADMQGEWGLHRTHIGATARLLSQCGFSIMEIKPRFFSFGSSLARLPLLGNLLSWHVEFYASKGPVGEPAHLSGDRNGTRTHR